MDRWATRFTIVLVVIAALAACSGPARRDATRVVAPAPTHAGPPTATAIAPTEPAATPTASVVIQTATRSPEATPTPRPSPTPTAIPAPNAVESALLAMLPAGDSLPDDWTLVASGPVRSRSGATLLCGVDSFPGSDEKLAEVEAEYLRTGLTSASVLQDVVAFPESVAVEAMAWARQTIVCDEWTDADGTTVSLDPFEDAGVGDESLSTTITITTDGDQVSGRWFFVRKGGLIATIAYLGSDATTAGVADAVVANAVGLLDPARAAAAALDPAVQSALLEVVLRPSDIGDGWAKTASGPTPSLVKVPLLCGAPLFDESSGALGDVTARFEHGSSGASVTQRLVAYPANRVVDVMGDARAAIACGELDGPDGAIYQLAPPAPVALDADGVTATFVGDAGYGALSVVRVGAVITTITIFSPEPLSTDDTHEVAARAVEHLRDAD